MMTSSTDVASAPDSPIGRVLERCAELAKISDEPGRITRSFLSSAMQRANTRVAGWMEKAGLRTELDAVGNLIGTYPCGKDGAPVLVLGSHLDTVRDAGRYDGVLGVVQALAVAEKLADAALPFDLEIIAFADEEGLRYGIPFLGSQALTGNLGPELLERRDEAGVTMLDPAGFVCVFTVGLGMQAPHRWSCATILCPPPPSSCSPPSAWHEMTKAWLQPSVR